MGVYFTRLILHPVQVYDQIVSGITETCPCNTALSYSCKNRICSIFLFLYLFLMIVQNIDCGHTYEYPQCMYLIISKLPLYATVLLYKHDQGMFISWTCLRAVRFKIFL